MTSSSKSKRPYLIRAMHEWMGDNGHTPHIVIDTTLDGVTVPTEHIKDEKIILNVSHSAAHNLKLTGADFIRDGNLCKRDRPGNDFLAWQRPA